MDGLKNLYMKTILSIDGGGIRGILPARILQEMRRRLDKNGDATIQDAAANLIITSFDTEAMEPHCIKKRDMHKDAYADHNYYMRDAARASSAAPTFFPPARISPIGLEDKKYSLIDGAVFANNPAGLAYVEAQKIFPEEKEFVILSLGTGDFKQGYSYEEVHAWGYMEFSG